MSNEMSVNSSTTFSNNNNSKDPQV